MAYTASTNGIQVKKEKTSDDYPPLSLSEDEENLDFGLDHDFLPAQSPLPAESNSAKDMENRNEDHGELLNVLKTFGMPELFPFFKDERIFAEQLAVISPVIVVAMMQKHFPFRLIIDFQEQLDKWRAQRGKDNSAKEDVHDKTVDGGMKKKKNEGKDSPGHSKEDETAKKKQKFPKLNKILRDNSDTAKLLDTYQLAQSHRTMLVNAVVNHFFENKIPFTQEARDEMARQIKENFMDEDEFYYSDNGLQRGGADKLFLRLRYLNEVSRKPRRKRVYKSIREGDSEEEEDSDTMQLKVSRVETLAPDQNAEKGKSHKMSNEEDQMDDQHQVPTVAAIIPPPLPIASSMSMSPPTPSPRNPPANVAPIVTMTATAPSRINVRPDLSAIISRPLQRSQTPPVKQKSQVAPVSMRRSSVYVDCPKQQSHYSPVIPRPQAVQTTATRPSASKASPSPGWTDNPTVRRIVTRRASVAHLPPSAVEQNKGVPVILQQRRPEANRSMEAPTNRPPPTKIQMMQLAKERQTAQQPTPAPKTVQTATTVAVVKGEGAKSAASAVKGPPPGFQVVGPNQSVAPIPRGAVNPVAPKPKQPPPPQQEQPKEQAGSINFMKADRFSNAFDLKDSLTSCLDLNKNMLSTNFEVQLGITNKFREAQFCEDFVRKMDTVFARNTRFNIDKTHFHDQTLNVRLAVTLFLLPPSLNSSLPFVFRGKMTNNFISVCPSVQEFVSSLPRNTDSPYVAIIGKLLAPVSFVVYYQKKVYKCIELWHALDMAIKIYLVYKQPFPSDMASCWQFLMIHFYDMEKDTVFVMPSVLRMRSMLRLMA